MPGPYDERIGILKRLGIADVLWKKYATGHWISNMSSFHQLTLYSGGKQQKGPSVILAIRLFFLVYCTSLAWVLVLSQRQLANCGEACWPKLGKSAAVYHTLQHR